MTDEELLKLVKEHFEEDWDVDMIESMEFCNWCYSKAGVPGPYYDMSFEMEDEE